MQELNERLANPPDINPANTEQLGLFVVGQLARRHGIRVMLRPSPYGGTTAVVLIPLALIVEDGPAAITSGPGAPRRPEPTGPTGPTDPVPTDPVPTGPTPAAATPRAPPGAATAGPPGPAAAGCRAGQWPPRTTAGPRPGPGYQSPGSPGPREAAADARGYGAGTQDQDRSAVRITGGLPLRHPGSAGTGAPGGFGASGGYDPGRGTGPSTGLQPGHQGDPGRHGTRRQAADGTAPMTSRS